MLELFLSKPVIPRTSYLCPLYDKKYISILYACKDQYITDILLFIIPQLSYYNEMFINILFTGKLCNEPFTDER